jgi:A/G-specific adenine glycosylase
LRTDRIGELPVKAGKTTVRERHFNYLHISDRRGTYLVKRTSKDIWHGLFSLPLIESSNAQNQKRFAASLEEYLGEGWTITAKHGPYKHVLSHQVIHAIFWEVMGPKGYRAPKEWIPVKPADLDRYALPRLIERYVNQDRP